jgi:peptidoglycan/LPS O-acetylase OafA/YrhL
MNHSPTIPNRVKAFDGVRGLACLMVLLWHYGNTPQRDAWPFAVYLFRRSLSLNWSGVDLFFVLSGFLLGGICLRQRDAANYFQAFYVRRICRIFPLYYLWLALWFVLPPLVNEQSYRNLFVEEPAWPYLTYLQNVWFSLQGHYGSAWLIVTWSLAVEEQFYLLLPSLIRFVPLRWLPRVLVGLIAAAPVARALVIYGLPESHAMAAYWLLPCRWDAMFLGVLAAYLTQTPAQQEWVRGKVGVLRGALAALGVCLVVLLVAMPDKTRPFTAIVGYSVIDVFFVLLVVLARFDDIFARWLSFGPLVGLGVISYGVYLFHIGVLGFLLGTLQGANDEVVDWSGAGVVLLATAATFALATVSYFLLEAPFVRLGHHCRYGSRPTPSPSATRLRGEGSGGRGSDGIQ